ncbi:MAG: aminoacyl-tRNA hydrolase [Candidatus Aenigmarchaeota archaeon]|nr:aminoacyl-tRNA hydrolase [Candidatus Aenigmarchaeota archaeon]
MKQVFVIRTNLKMGKGKIAAQVAHAAIELYKKASREEIDEWEREGSKKVVLKVSGLEEMEQIRNQCHSQKIKTCYIHDAGHTQVEAGSLTVLGIGPVEDEKIDRITGHLKMV